MTMRVLHLAYTYFPDEVGGTEVYVRQLALELGRREVQSVVAAPGRTATRYAHGGTPVIRFAVPAPDDRAELVDATGNAAAVAALHDILDEQRPDVVHFHAYSRGVPAEVGEGARRRGIPVVVTYHTPTVTCARGTLLLNGERECDGRLLVGRCSRCMLRLVGAPRVAADVFASTPVAIGRAVGHVAPRAGGPATLLRMPAMMARRHARVRRHLIEADRVVAPANWVAALLVAEGVRPDRVVVSPQGVSDDAASARRVPRAGGPVRLALPARYSPEKGIHVVIAAIRAMPDVPLVLDIFGPEQGIEGRRTRQALERQASGDPRIHFGDGVGTEEARERIAAADGVVIPSQVKETGPLVLLEAFAAGVPVIGTALGGVAERVSPGHNGLLVAPGDVAGWSAALAQFCGDAALRARLASAVRPPRTMGDVADDMVRLYSTLAKPAASVLTGTR